MRLNKNQILFQYFEPDRIEENDSELCIWCLRNEKKNKAHIFSKKIIVNKNDKRNLLLKSVCIECNSKWSKLVEDWLFKSTHLKFYSDLLIENKVYYKDKYNTKLIFVPEINNWSIVLTNDNSEILPTQLIFFKIIDNLWCYGNESTFKNKSDFIDLINSFKDKIYQNEYHIYINNKYPSNFAPRAFKYNQSLIITGISQQDCIDTINKIKSNNSEGDNSELIKLEKIETNEVVRMYKWSIVKYVLLCSKISLEFISKIEGTNYVLSKDFDHIRNNCFNQKFYDENNIQLSNSKGLLIKNHLPKGLIFVNNKINFTQEEPLLFDHQKNDNSHQIIYYCLGNLLISRVKLFNIDVCNLVVAELDKPFKHIIIIEYDYIKNEFKFLKSLDEKDANEILKDINYR